MLMRINGFCKTQRKEGRKFNMGVNEIVFTRGPWNLMTFKNKECRSEKSVRSVHDWKRSVSYMARVAFRAFPFTDVALLSQCACVRACF